MSRPTGQDVVRIAHTQVGTEEHPAGSNTGVAVRKYQGATFLAGSGWPWCVAFWQWCMREAGAPLPYGGAGAYDMLEWAKRSGWARTVPSPGDGVVFNIGAGHLGVFSHLSGGSVHTIDGNWDDKVSAVSHPAGLVRGYVRNMHLVLGHHEAPEQSRPLIQITTSASGHRKVVATTHSRKGAARWLAHASLRAFPNGVTITRRRPSN